MKLTPSPSISTPKGSVYGCISFVFRRILCSRRPLPTHPFDQFNEIQNQKSESPTTPNLVARLMGLDSMPEGKITRSKSVNLADCRVEETGEVKKKHRRVKSSVSCKEMTPCYFELEDDDFFVIRFESGRRSRKSRTKKKKVESESDDQSENLSPVSVLDHTLFNGDHEELNTTEEEETNNAKCSKQEDDNKEATEAKQENLQRKDYHSHQNIEMLNLICRLAGSEMANSEWDCKKKKMIGDLEMWEVEIGAELGLQILDQLVDEVVNQLFCCAN